MKFILDSISVVVKAVNSTSEKDEYRFCITMCLLLQEKIDYKQIKPNYNQMIPKSL